MRTIQHIKAKPRPTNKTFQRRLLREFSSGGSIWGDGTQEFFIIINSQNGFDLKVRYCWRGGNHAILWKWQTGWNLKECDVEKGSASDALQRAISFPWKQICLAKKNLCKKRRETGENNSQPKMASCKVAFQKSKNAHSLENKNLEI